MAIYIEQGILINAAWTEFIAVSKDGVNWETINRSDLMPIGRFINQSSNPELRHPAENKGTHANITLRNNFTEAIALFFDPNDVVNQPTWQGNTQVALNNAIADLSTWISA